MKKIKEIIVVEGKDDTRRLKEVLGQVDTIETIGSAIDEKILEQIAFAQEKRGVIVLTDPDFPGEQIRKKIMQAVPNAKHAFLTKKEGKGKKVHESLGVEHASPEAIKRALSDVYTPQQTSFEMLPLPLLQQLGLVNGSDAKLLRQRLGEKLKIGYTNGKQLQKRLQMFGITQEEVKKALEEIKEGKYV